MTRFTLLAVALAGCGGAVSVADDMPTAVCTLYPTSSLEQSTDAPLYVTDAGASVDGAPLPDGWAFVPPHADDAGCSCGLSGPAGVILGLCGAFR